jgi:energy-coupling factor transport system substrate-specific component
MLASMTSAFCSYLLDYFLYDYNGLSLGMNILQLCSFLISSAFFAGVLTLKISERLMRLGLLDQFLIAKE